tara:strand:- start:100 stop:423 length:324 start_codon:yes stop_codon:yes gene_type:complete
MRLEHKMLITYDVKLEGKYDGKRGMLYLAKVKNKRQYELVLVPQHLHFWNMEDNYETLYVSTKSYEDTIKDIMSALVQHATFYAPRQNQFEKVVFDFETLSSKYENR